MNKVIGAVPALLLVVTSALPTRAAPLGPSLPSGASDQVIFSGPGSLPNRVDIPEAAGGAEPTAVFDCDSSICIPGAAVALTEPGRPTVVSDLLTVSGGEAAAPLLSPQQLVLPVQIVFRSDSEGDRCWSRRWEPCSFPKRASFRTCLRLFCSRRRLVLGFSSLPNQMSRQWRRRISLARPCCSSERSQCGRCGRGVPTQLALEELIRSAAPRCFG
jgi:hypothetical protein